MIIACIETRDGLLQSGPGRWWAHGPRLASCLRITTRLLLHLVTRPVPKEEAHETPCLRLLGQLLDASGGHGAVLSSWHASPAFPEQVIEHVEATSQAIDGALSLTPWRAPSTLPLRRKCKKRGEPFGAESSSHRRRLPVSQSSRVPLSSCSPNPRQAHGRAGFQGRTWTRHLMTFSDTVRGVALPSLTPWVGDDPQKHERCCGTWKEGMRSDCESNRRNIGATM